MDLLLCDGTKLTLKDGTVGSFSDDSGNIETLVAYGDCWKKVAMLGVRVNFDRDTESHFEYESTTTDVPASCDTLQSRKIQAVKVCKDKLGNIIKCPPR